MMRKLSVFFSASLVGLSAPAMAAPIISSSALQVHNDQAGGVGVDIIVVKKPEVFGDECAALSTVKIEYTQRRYGKVEVDKGSMKACKSDSCKLQLNWTHAPAGRLSYRVKAHWKQKKCK